MNTVESSTDAELLAAFCREGSERAFAEISRRHGALVFGTACRILENPADAEDAAQAAFIALAIKARHLDARAGLAPWLYTVTVRAALDHKKAELRRTRRHETLADVSPERHEDRPEVDDALRRLPAKLRDTLVWHYFEGLGVEEIARREGCSPSAVSMRLTRGRERMRKLLGRDLAIALGVLAVTAPSREAVAALAGEAASTAVRAVAGLRMAEPALSQLLQAARQALRPTFSELLRPVAAGLAGGAVIVTAALTLSPRLSASDEHPAADKLPPVERAASNAQLAPTPTPAALHPLIVAIRKSYNWETMNAFVQVYRQYQSEVNTIHDATGRTALHWATSKGDDEFAALMIIDGADVNVEDGKGWTPLFYAVKRGSTWTQLLLILKGAQINHMAKDGATPLSLAIERGDARAVEILLWTGASPAPADVPPDRQPLALAQAKGNEEITALVQDYLQPGAAVFSEVSSGLPAFVRNPLHEAARKGDFPMLDQLRKSGLGINTRDEKGRTPLHEAVSAGQADVVFYLLMMGADPNAVDNEGRSPLGSTMGWLGGGLDANRRFLLAKGANPNALRKDGHTELTWAVQRDNEHGVQWLLWMKVDPRQKTQQGTSFEVAVREGNQRIIDLLRRNGVDGPTRLSNDPAWLLKNGAQRGDIAVIDEALAAGAQVDAPDEKGNTALMTSIYKRNVPAALHLLERGAALDYVNPKNGWTPLLATIIWDYGEMTDFRKALLEAGADPNAAANDGTTPLMRSVWYEPTMPMKQLLEAGADLNLRDKQGRTALGRAINDGKLKTADYLRSLGATE